MGTPAYMAPEQAEGRTADHRADIYSLGLVLYEMFTGSPAFSGDTPVTVALKQIRETPPPPRQLEPTLPPPIENVILRCLEKNPSARFQSATEVQSALTAALRQVSATQPGVPQERRPRYWPVAVNAVLVLALVAVGGWYFLIYGPARLAQPVQSDQPPASQSVRQPKGEPPPASQQVKATEPESPHLQPRSRPSVHRSLPPSLQEEAERAKQRQDDINRRLADAEQAFKKRDYGAAITSYEFILALDPNNQTAKKELERIRQVKAAAAAKQRQDDISRRLAAARQAFEQGDYDTAITSYEFILALDPNNQTAKNELEQVRQAKAAEERVLRRLKPPG